jgi:hypothetical protein
MFARFFGISAEKTETFGAENHENVKPRITRIRADKKRTDEEKTEKLGTEK